MYLIRNNAPIAIVISGINILPFESKIIPTIIDRCQFNAYKNRHIIDVQDYIEQVVMDTTSIDIDNNKVQRKKKTTKIESDKNIEDEVVVNNEITENNDIKTKGEITNASD